MALFLVVVVVVKLLMEFLLLATREETEAVARLSCLIHVLHIHYLHLVLSVQALQHYL